jgi:hypothetical protein
MGAQLFDHIVHAKTDGNLVEEKKPLIYFSKTCHSVMGNDFGIVQVTGPVDQKTLN